MDKFGQVTAGDVESAIFSIGSHTLIGEYGLGHHREIKVDLGSKWFTVWDHGKEVAGTSFASTAADVYNKIQPRPEE